MKHSIDRCLAVGEKRQQRDERNGRLQPCLMGLPAPAREIAPLPVSFGALIAYAGVHPTWLPSPRFLRYGRRISPGLGAPVHYWSRLLPGIHDPGAIRNTAGSTRTRLNRLPAVACAAYEDSTRLSPVQLRLKHLDSVDFDINELALSLGMGMEALHEPGIVKHNTLQKSHSLRGGAVPSLWRKVLRHRQGRS